VLFPQLYGKCQGKTRKDGARPALSHIICYLCCSVVICVVGLLFVLFCVLFVCKCVLPSGDNPIAVNKYKKVSKYCTPADGYRLRAEICRSACV
jgi:hypothetical protein